MCVCLYVNLSQTLSLVNEILFLTFSICMNCLSWGNFMAMCHPCAHTQYICGILIQQSHFQQFITKGEKHTMECIQNEK